MGYVLALLFEIDGQRYALDARHVVEVIARVELRPIHRSPAELAGAFVYRGEVTPVVDLGLLIAGRRCPERLSSRILITKLPSGSGTWTVGLLAEHVTEAVRLEPGETWSASDPARQDESAADGARMIRMLQPEAVVDPAWRDALSPNLRAGR